MNRIAGERVVAAALIAASFALGYWLRQPATQAQPHRGAATANAKETPRPGAPTSAPAKPSPAPRALGTADIHEQMTAVLRTTVMTEKFMQLGAVLAQLSPANWRGMLTAFEEARKRGEENPEAWSLFVRRAGEVAGKDAVAHFASAPDLDSARSALTGWAATHPVEALQWLSRDASSELHRQIVGAAMRGLAASEPELAVSVLEGIPLERRANYIRDFVPSLVRGAGVAQAEEIVDRLVRSAVANRQGGEDYVKGIFADLAALKVRRAAVSGDLTGLADWVKAHVNQPYSDTSIVWGTSQELARVDVARALAWLDTLHAAGPVGEPGNPMGYGTALVEWANKEGTAVVATWLQQNSGHPRYDHMVAQYTAFLPSSRAAEATRLAETIRDATLRATALKKIADLALPKPKR